MWGYFSGSVTLISVSLMFRYCKGVASLVFKPQINQSALFDKTWRACCHTWSTECNVPHMLESKHIQLFTIYSRSSTCISSVKYIIQKDRKVTVLTSSHSWVPQQHLCQPKTWRRSRRAEKINEFLKLLKSYSLIGRTKHRLL